MSFLWAKVHPFIRGNGNGSDRDIKEDGKMETTSSVYGEEPEVDESEWKIENDKILMTHNDQTGNASTRTVR